MAMRDFVADLGFTKIHLAYLPVKYVAGELSIRFIGDSTESETGYHYRLDRDYQFVVFGTSERDCLVKSGALQRRFNSAHKLRIGESGYMTLGSFSLSPPFKSDDSIVYGVIGILQAQVREARYFAPVPKIAEVSTTVTPISPLTGEPTGEDFDANTGREGAVT